MPTHAMDDAAVVYQILNFSDSHTQPVSPTYCPLSVLSNYWQLGLFLEPSAIWQIHEHESLD